MSSDAGVGFHPDRPCARPDEHDGRSELVEDVVSLLGADELPAIALIGERRTGKTSLLNQLRGIHRDVGLHEGRLHLLQLDVAALAVQSYVHFFTLLFETDVIGHIAGARASYGDFDDVVSGLEKRDERLVLLLDNFHTATNNPKLKLDFFEYLRSKLSTCQYLGCVVTAPANLEDRCYDELRDSPFFNIFHTRVLRPLERDEARRLLARRLPAELARADEAIEAVVRAVGPQPYLLHVAGKLWLEHWRSTKNPDVADALERAYRASLGHYRHVCDNLSDKQRSMVRRAAEGASVSSHEVDNDFLDRGWLRYNGGRLGFGSLHFERFVREQLGVKPKKGLLDWLLGRRTQ